jgi:hypothetical protein
VIGARAGPQGASAEGNRELKVHLAQANNQSPYAFVRAKFEPGELADPWAVRFFDERGAEVPYFVWDSVTWRVAREGRDDWGRRYALINHAPGNSSDVLEAREQKIQWAEKKLPSLGKRLKIQEEAARRAGDSVCAVLYLLRRSVPAFGKERLSLRLYRDRQVEPKTQRGRGPHADEPLAIAQGQLGFQGLPDHLTVTWRDREFFRCSGFDTGGTADTVSHADPSRPSIVETTSGMITKLAITGQTKWRSRGAIDWQCTYWLFPEGGYVGLEGFSLTNPGQYRGGPQTLSILAPPEGVAEFTASHEPDWDRPWWLHQVGDRGFLATHPFFATPLTIGYCNNPFTVNAEGPNKDPRVEAAGTRLALRWFHELNDPAIMRLMTPQPMRRPSDPPSPPPQPVAWEPNVDWLYRQYVVGVGERAEDAEGALRGVLGAAAGWIDRPVSEEEVASLLVGMMDEIGQGGQTAEIGLLRVVPAVLKNDQAAIQHALRDRFLDVVGRTDFYIDIIRRSVEQGQKPSGGGKALPDGSRWEGWTGNPGYHASLMPCYLRVLEFFDLSFPRDAYRQAIVRYADFGLELLGGQPPDIEKFRTVLEGEWPSRTVSTAALMLHAYRLQPDEKYARAARVLFDDLLRLVERNPHGYFPVWSFQPKADKYDTVYNPVSYDRGINAFWFEDSLGLIGRDAAARFVAAQARWFVFSGQLLDTLEMDNVTAIRACTHGGHTNLRNQIGLYLYDDFEFYRGLLGDLVAWSAASSQVPGQARHMGTSPYRRLTLSNATSSMVRWALDIRPDNKWLQSEVQRLKEPGGFRLRAWNRLPQARPTIPVTAQDAGLKSEADVLQVQLSGPAFRQPAEFEVTPSDDKVSLKVSRSATLRLYYRTLCPDWPPEPKPLLQRRHADGRTEALRDAVWESGSVEWQAVPGAYELRRP